jgi:hypothetical protein
MSPTPTGGAYAGKTMGSGQPIPMIKGTNTPDINAIIGQMVDRGKWYYYDTLKLAPGATVANQYSFFANAIGQPDPYNGNQTKTNIETNLPTANIFNPPYDMILNNLGFLFLFDNRLQDITTIVKHCWFEFKILDKTFFMGHLWRHPPGSGLSGFSTQTSESSWGIGLPDPGAIYSFGNWAKYIAPLMRFTLTLNFPETYNQMYNSTLTAQQTAQGVSGTSLPTLLTTAQGGNGIWIVAFMNGLTDRAVQ